MGQGESSATQYATVRVLVNETQLVPGQLVRGAVTAVVVAPTRVTELHARLRCVLDVRLDGDRAQTTVHDEHVCCHVFRGGVAEPGNYSFPFQFQLPLNAAPSVHLAHRPRGTGSSSSSGGGGGGGIPRAEASVSHAVTAELRWPGWLYTSRQEVDRAPVAVHAQAAARAGPASAAHISRSIDWGFSVFRSAGQLEARATTDREAYQPGGACRVAVYLDNQSNVAFGLQTVKLLETAWLRGHWAAKDLKLDAWTLRAEQQRVSDERWVSVDGAGAGAAHGALRGAGQDAVRQEQQRREFRGGTAFGNKGQATCLRFAVRLPLNIAHESVDLRNLKVRFALAVTLQPRSLFGEKLVLQVPIRICTAAHEDDAPPVAGGAVSASAARLPHSATAEAVPVATPVDVDGKGCAAPTAVKVT